MQQGRLGRAEKVQWMSGVRRESTLWQRADDRTNENRRNNNTIEFRENKYRKENGKKKMEKRKIKNLLKNERKRGRKM